MTRKALPLDQRKYLADNANGQRADFIEGFCKKFANDVPSHLIYNRASSLWARKLSVVADFVKEREEKAIADRTVMVPARIVNKAVPGEMRKPAGMGDRADIDELLVKQNNLLAEIVVLLKERIEIQSGLLANQGQMIGNQRETLKLFNDAKGMAE